MIEDHRWDNPTLRIWQQNLNKSYAAQHDMLSHLSPERFDIALIQEPYLDHNNFSRGNNHFRAIYPSTHGKADALRTRSFLLISTRIPTATWSAIPTGSPDITAINLQTLNGPLLIFNVYNDCNHSDALMKLDNIVTETTGRLKAEGRNYTIVWAGDFNRHHPMWDEERNCHLFTNENLEKAELLISLTEKYDLAMTLPKDIATLEAANTKNLTRPDNVFMSQEAVEQVVRCDSDPSQRPAQTDHFPIFTTLNLATQTIRPKERWNFRATDWEKFKKKLAGELTKIPPPKNPETRKPSKPP